MRVLFGSLRSHLLKSAKLFGSKTMRSICLTSLATALVALTNSSLAIEGIEGLYVNAEGGVNLVDDIEPDVAFGRVVSLDPGFRIGASVGYTFFQNEIVATAGQFDTGFLYNDIETVSGFGPTDGHFWQIPFIVSAVATFLPESRVKPYIGIGGGGISGELTVGTNEGRETNGALQGMAGVRAKLWEHGDIGIGYKGLISFPKDIDRITSHAIMVSYTFGF